MTTTANQDRVYFLLKDPHWTFVWWEICVDTRSAAAAELGTHVEDLQQCIRVHDITDVLFDGQNSHSCFDVPVHGVTDHWYLYVPVSGRVYCVEFGFKGPRGFRPVARSSPVYLPRGSEADSSNETYSTIDLR